MKRGYDIVDPDLARSALALNYDAQVRCLSYLIGQLSNIVDFPQGVMFEVIPVQHHYGGPYPIIGLYTETPVTSDENLLRLGLAIGDELDAYIKKVGTERLLELSSEETATWQDILSKFNLNEGGEK